MKKIETLLEKLIFGSRWIQLPVYVGLVLASVVYAIFFIKEVVHMVMHASHFTEQELMLVILSLIDVSMVFNLIIVVIIGGYTTFVSKLNIDNHEDRPDWLEKVNSGTLKIKLMVSLVSISGIHLLKSFLEIGTLSRHEAVFQIAIHVVFVVSSLIMAWTDKIMHDSH